MTDELKKSMLRTLRGQTDGDTFGDWLAANFADLTIHDLRVLLLNLERERNAGLYDPRDINSNSCALADNLESELGRPSDPDGYAIHVEDDGKLHFLFSVEDIDGERVAVQYIGWLVTQSEFEDELSECGSVNEVSARYGNYIDRDLDPHEAVRGLPLVDLLDLQTGTLIPGATYFLPW